MTTSPVSVDDECSRAALAQGFAAVRAHSAALCEGLSAEDMALQSMPDASPLKWQLGHTSWFFDVLLLQPHLPGYALFDERWLPLFNSYYEALGPRHPRPKRGLLSRPSLDEVWRYRRHVEAGVRRFIAEAGEADWAAGAPVLRLGLHHEQQHQELMLTDLLHALSLNPLAPAWRPGAAPRRLAAGPSGWAAHEGGIVEVGHAGPGFAFDNEGPRHRVLLAAFALASRLVSNAEFLAFLQDGGYQRPEFWLSDGWALAQAQGWRAPLYWQWPDDPAGWPDKAFTLHGLQALDPEAPVAHLSAYEAAAYAAWAGARLPTEFELEQAARAEGQTEAGERWCWTGSAYAPYPGFRPLPGPAAEYNGKFMINQLVLRGGSVATPPGHWRPTYRNFFPPGARWQFSGLRLARDGDST
jgi:ergothioneine biosynthesis protein EgtB